MVSDIPYVKDTASRASLKTPIVHSNNIIMNRIQNWIIYNSGYWNVN